ncbi:Protein REVEILLE 1 [Forsythia ovata]|uniref:Protein REVEILLE 1 n=1 Tax=Forsythia ovata TaxID=205694 RepID=A0ABD1WP23_9LAMI
MVVQDQSEGNGLDTVLPTDDFAPKVRKPYTITKQRERWTEEEHKKFLEALQLYGRAWRNIEEHVGTKSAVQIRSHAQKFFSKVVRESDSGIASSVKPIEIPPPRPKRKPMHPYPRKRVSPFKTGVLASDKPTRSTSSNLSVPEQENQSPTSVLSAFGSDVLGRTYSSTPDGSPSTLSSSVAVNDGTIVYSKPANLMLEETRSCSPGQNDARSSQDVQAPKKLEVLSQNDAIAKEDLNESSTQYLKLFGKTLLVTDPHGPCYPTLGTCKPQTLDGSDGTYLQTLPWNFMPKSFSPSDSELASSALSHGAPISLCQKNDKSNSMDACRVSFPWLTLCGSTSLQSLQVHNPTPIKARPSLDKKEEGDKDDQNEGSSTGSNTDLVGASSDEEKSSEVEAQSSHLSMESEEEEKSPSSSKLSEKARGNSVNCKKGFVPYKRCLAERDSTVSRDVREEQRIHLCL